jgi:HEAT repeat protein
MRLVPLLLLLLAGAPADAPDPADPERIAALIRDLGADDWDVREAAYRELEKLGARAAPQLEEARRGDDLEIRRAAERLLGDARSSRDRRLLAGLSQPSAAFEKSEAKQRLLAGGREAVTVILGAIRTQNATYPRYDYNVLRNAYSVLHGLAASGRLGRDDLPTLLRLLDTENTNSRYLARPLLATLAGDDLPGILDAIVLDEEESGLLRASALAILDAIDREASVRRLDDALADGAVAVRRVAARLLWNRTSPEHLPGLLRAAADPDAAVRAAVVQALQRHAEDRAAREIVRAALKDADENVRRSALQAATRIIDVTGDRSLVPPVRDFLSSGDATVVNAAANLLGNVRDRDATPHLLAVLKHGEPEFRRIVLTSVLNALGRIADPTAREPIEGLLDDETFSEDPRMRSARVHALQALLRIAGEEALPRVSEALAEDDDYAPQILLQTLHEVPGAARVPIYLRFLDHANEFVVARAVQGLGLAGAVDAAPLLAKHLDAEQPYLRQSLLEALAALGSPEAAPRVLVLVEELVDEEGASRPSDSYVLRLAVEALAAARHRPAEPILRRMLGSGDRLVPTVAKALGRLDCRDARPEIEKLLAAEPEGSSARRELAAALAALGAPEAIRRIHAEDVQRLREGGENWRSMLWAADSAARAGLLEDALRLARQVLEQAPRENRAHYDVACVRAIAGRRAEALATLTAAVELGYRNPRGALRDPDLESLRRDPAFLRLLIVMSRR